MDCKICAKIRTKYRRRDSELEKLNRWRRDGGVLKKSVEKAQLAVTHLEQEIIHLECERQNRQMAVTGREDSHTRELLNSTIKAPSQTCTTADEPKTLICDSEISALFRGVHDKGECLMTTLVLTSKGNAIEAAFCGDYMQRTYGNMGSKLLKHVRHALESTENNSSCPDMVVQVADDKITVTNLAQSPDLTPALTWLCLAVRKPEPETLTISTGYTNTDLKNNKAFTLQNLLPLRADTVCWHALMKSAVIAVEPCTRLLEHSWLQLDFNMMVQLSTVEHAVKVGSGLILMGYSTVLVPIKMFDEDTIVWHLEVCSHDSQFKIAEVEAIRSTWLKTLDFTLLKSKKAKLGWRPEAAVLLGTERLQPTVRWSKGKTKRITWTWKGVNIQAITSSAAPVQIGLQGGATFERTPNLLRFDLCSNYLRLLNSSSREVVVIYDLGTKRAWLVSLLSIFHHMAITYCQDIPSKCQIQKIPFAQPQADGGKGSLEALRASGGILIEREDEDSLSLRQLIMGLSVNFAKTSTHKPCNNEIYGYEFMDIVWNSPMADLKKIRIERQGLTWAPLLQHIPCLFCSNLGDAIVGSDDITNASLCNNLVPGRDLMAASLWCMHNISERQGGSAAESEYRFPGGYWWKATGNVFQKCRADTCDCWRNMTFVQQIHANRSKRWLASDNTTPSQVFVDGVVVFGSNRRSAVECLVRSVKWAPIRQELSSDGDCRNINGS
ncbi:hypothetical protein FQN54_007337 [Arachnomyces sp. PD_36]|nr:hypothetical protein FQN54_007337 [Arachnomyces sp. PD_36]